MALTWSFDEKIGTVLLTDKKTKKEYTWNLYKGNAFAIMTWEDKDTYTVTNFWCDEPHAKRCLGLTKGYDNCYEGGAYDYTFELDANYEHTFKIAKLLQKANIKFTLKN